VPRTVSEHYEPILILRAIPVRRRKKGFSGIIFLKNISYFILPTSRGLLDGHSPLM
jgi:hypothetical protein